MSFRSYTSRNLTRTYTPALRAFYHDYVRYPTPGVRQFSASLREGLEAVTRWHRARALIEPQGNWDSAIKRDPTEDFYSFATLGIDPEELRLTARRHAEVDWDPKRVPDTFANEVAFCGIYDGHGGSTVSQYLRQELHGLFESMTTHEIPELYAWVKELGGYFKRFNGEQLRPWINPDVSQERMDLHARALATFFQVDRNLSSEPAAKTSGSTASVAIIHTLDAPFRPFYSAEKVALTVAHVGDTRVLLCAVQKGRVFSMTENHRAETRIESQRLRRMMGFGMMTDSFGDARWMGVLQNTRSLGDLKWKPFGVTAEPTVRTRYLDGRQWAFAVLVSDGVSGCVSDQEIVDLARDAPDPRRAAERILRFAETMGSDDNMTAIVLPLAGWGTVTGPDMTQQLRDYRTQQMDGAERQKQMY